MGALMLRFSRESVCVFGLLCLLFPRIATADGSGRGALPVERQKQGKGETEFGNRKGVLSLGLAFSSQGSPYGRETVGFRYGLTSDFWVGLFAQHTQSTELDARAWGVHVETGIDVLQIGRAVLSPQLTVAFGQDEVVSPDADPVGQDQFGLAVGVQGEVFLLPELSLAIKLEWGGLLFPAEQRRLTTGTSELLLFFHF